MLNPKDYSNEDLKAAITYANNQHTSLLASILMSGVLESSLVAAKDRSDMDNLTRAMVRLARDIQTEVGFIK